MTESGGRKERRYNEKRLDILGVGDIDTSSGVLLIVLSGLLERAGVHPGRVILALRFGGKALARRALLQILLGRLGQVVRVEVEVSRLGLCNLGLVLAADIERFSNLRARV